MKFVPDSSKPFLDVLLIFSHKRWNVCNSLEEEVAKVSVVKPDVSVTSAVFSVKGGPVMMKELDLDKVQLQTKKGSEELCQLRIHTR